MYNARTAVRAALFSVYCRAGYKSSTLFSQGYFEVGVPSLYFVISWVLSVVR